MTNETAQYVTHAVVLAGGLGTRINAVLGSRPKALAEIAGRPFLDWKVQELRRNSVDSVTFLLGHGSGQIVQLLQNHDYDLKLDWVMDGPQLLGTGGALANALHRLPNNFYLTYGDNLLDMPYGELIQAAAEAQTSCALAVTSTIGPADRPNSVVSGSRVSTYSKVPQEEMAYLDYGVMLLNRATIQDIIAPLEPPFDLAVVLSALASTSNLAAAITEKPYWEIGTPLTLKQTDRAMESRDPRTFTNAGDSP